MPAAPLLKVRRPVPPLPTEVELDVPVAVVPAPSKSAVEVPAPPTVMLTKVASAPARTLSVLPLPFTTRPLPAFTSEPLPVTFTVPCELCCKFVPVAVRLPPFCSVSVFPLAMAKIDDPPESRNGVASIVRLPFALNIALLTVIDPVVLTVRSVVAFTVKLPALSTKSHA